MTFYQHFQTAGMLLLLTCTSSLTSISETQIAVSSVSSSDEKNNKTKQLEIMVIPSLDVNFSHQIESKEEPDHATTSHDESRNVAQSIEETIPIAVLSFNESVIIGAINYTLKTGNWSSEVHKSEPKNISMNLEHVPTKNVTIIEVPEQTIELLAKVISEAKKTFEEVLLKLRGNSSFVTNLPEVQNSSTNT